MAEHTEQTAAQPGAVPVRVELEDFIEAVTRGVMRALAAEEEVSGYAASLSGRTTPTTGPIIGRPPILIGIIAPPTGPFEPQFPVDATTAKA